MTIAIQKLPKESWEIRNGFYVVEGVRIWFDKRLPKMDASLLRADYEG